MKHLQISQDLADKQLPEGAPPNPAPAWYMIGRGYDVVNGSINPSFDGLKDPLLKIDSDSWVKDFTFMGQISGDGQIPEDKQRLAWSHPTYINAPETFTSGHAEYIEATSQEAYGSSLRASLKVEGSYYGFSASVEAQFGENESRVSNRRFVSRAGHYVFGALEAKSPGDLVPFLRDEVKKDLMNLQPEDLFDKYGTHYVHLITLGASIYDVYKFDEDKISSETNLKGKVTAAYKGLFKIKGSAEIDKDDTSSQLESSSEHDVIVVGGDPTAASRMANGEDGAFEKWLSSIFTFPVPVSFTEHGLKPLWELVSDEKRQQQLHGAYELYATNGAAKNLEQAMPLRDGDFVAFQSFVSGGWVEGNRGAFLRVASGPRTDRARFRATGIEGSRVRLRNISSDAPINVFGMLSVKDTHDAQDEFEIVETDEKGLFQIKTASERLGQVVDGSFWFLKEGDFGGGPEVTQGTDGTVQVTQDSNADPDLLKWRIFVLGPPLGS